MSVPADGGRHEHCQQPDGFLGKTFDASKLPDIGDTPAAGTIKLKLATLRMPRAQTKHI